jgi:hypothetical protein
LILELLLDIAVGIARWGLAFLGTDEPPEWLTTVGTFINSQIQGFAGLGAWVPWDFAILVAGANLTLWLVFLLVKAIRWVVGWIPTMGGS